ncbi:MAG: aldo/keto reductase [Armatimonadetes bacterium]|nr:aldo/keto reductase [Armatimonadota bacterium]
MKFRRFGKTGLRLPVFTFGAMRIPGVPEEQAVATVRRAVALGINHLETARGYGTSEVLIGKALAGLDRDDLIITTKIPPQESASEMRRCIEESLSRMGIRRIDNLDVHGINNPDLLGLALKPGGSLAAIRRARDEGLVGHVGFSTHGPLELILETMRTGEFESVNLHYFYFNQRNAPVIRLAEEMDMGVLIISPTDKGGQLFNPPPLLAELTAPYTPIAIAHRFLLADPAITTLTIGAAHPDHFDAHLAVADQDGPLTDAEQAVFARLEARLAALGGTRCTLCHECLPCPEQINIPEVLRLRNLGRAFEMEDFGRYRYNMIGNGSHWLWGQQGDHCTDCGECLPRCPEGLKIPELLRDAHALFSGEKGKRLWSHTD